MPRKPKDAVVATEVSDTPTLNIRPQITQMSPVTVAELDSDAPVNTDDRPRGPNGRLLKADGTERKQRNMGARTRNIAPPVDPLMSDPRYVEAIQGLNFFGAPRVIKRSFSMASNLTKDPDIALNSEEEKHVDNYFYALSKHMTFDPMAHLIGRVILFALLMGELVMWRYLKYSPFGKHIKELLKPTDEQEPTPNDNSPVM